MWVDKLEHAADSTPAETSYGVFLSPAYLVFGDACGLFLVTWSLGGGRDVIEALAEEVLAYCQPLPSEERTFYLLAAGHSKVSM